VLSLDLGARRVGAAVSDPSLTAVRALEALNRSNWKQLLREVSAMVTRFDAKTLVIGFPLSLDGHEDHAAAEARATAQKFARSLALPVFLQDERLTSQAANERLREAGLRRDQIAARIDSEAAAIILEDFLSGDQSRLPVAGALTD
jgi:putative holliday junction resolvase